MNVDVVVIGGGISGAYIANSMDTLGKNFVLLEASYKVGGRHLTVKKDDEVLYEAGAWRVHSSHSRILDLLKKLNMSVRKLEPQKKRPPVEKIKGLSALDTLLLKNDGDVEKSFREERETGYEGGLDADSTSHPYMVEGDKGEYFVVDQGQEEIIDKLLEKIDKKRILTHHRVQDIQKKKEKYLIEVLVEKQNGEIAKKFFKADHVFSCVAQFDAWSWTVVQKYLYPLLNSVKPHPLNHIYATGEKPKDFKSLRVQPDFVLQQTIAPTNDEEWYQVSYSAGRIAEFWYRYRLKYGDTKLKKLVEKLSGRKLQKVESYFWSHAYHLWIPTPQFDIKKNVQNSIVPNPVFLPNFRWAGECFSSYQGWSEGALETAELALMDFIAKGTGFCPIYKKVPEKYTEYMIFDKTILDVKSWKNTHPGSKALIVKHLGEDISERFRFIKHSELSWASLFSLRVGFLES